MSLGTRKSFTQRKKGLIINMRDYDSWLTSFLDYEDDDGLTDEEREELKDLYDEWVISQYEQTLD